MTGAPPAQDRPGPSDAARRAAPDGMPGSPRGEAASTGACFGCTIASPLRLRYLRGGSGGPVLAVTERDGPAEPSAGPPVMEWTRRPGYDLHARLYAGPGRRHRLWTDREGWFDMDPLEQRITVPACDDEVRREERLWGIPAAVCMVVSGHLLLHAAAVEVGGAAILLAAPGMFGKTTLAGSFHQHGYRLLAEDMSACCFEPSPAVLPGPAMLRVRRDMYERLRFGGEVVAEEPHRVHLALEGDRRGGGGAVPVAAVLLLRRGDGAPRLERVAPEQALPDLWTLSFKLSGDQDRARCFEHLAQVAAEVPIYNLRRALRPDTIGAVIETVVSAVSRH